MGSCIVEHGLGADWGYTRTDADVNANANAAKVVVYRCSAADRRATGFNYPPTPTISNNRSCHSLVSVQDTARPDVLIPSIPVISR